MKIKDLMTPEVEVLEQTATLQEAAQLMRDINAGCIPIVEDGRAIGMLTDRDIVVRGVAEGLDPADAKAGDIMTPDVVSCTEDQDEREASELMAAKQVRRLVVLDRNGKLAGVLSLGDLAVQTEDKKKVGEILEGVSVAARQELAASRIEDELDEDEIYADGDIGYLVRGELAAVETYRQAEEKVKDEKEAAAELHRIEEEHEEAAQLLQEQMASRGMTPPRESGVWGAWARTIEGAAQTLGAKAVLKALKEGEEHGIHDYEDALRDESLDFKVKEIISSRLLPATRAHLPVLDRFLQAGLSPQGSSAGRPRRDPSPRG